MALDHANYFIAQRHPVGEHWGGVFPSYNSSVAFITRFVTHLSAPGFFFLMGVGVVLFTSQRLSQGWSLAQVRRHFLLRGSILIALQFVVINPIWKISSIPFPRWYQGVLAALGGTMIISLLLLRLSTRVLLGITVILSVGLELAHPDPSRWEMLSGSKLGLTFIYSGGSSTYWVNYPVLVWLEFVTLGMVFGGWFRDQPELAFKRGLMVGAGLLVAFVPIRLLNGFGNIRPSAGSTWIDFLNVVKYPPGWTFSFMTMGLNLLLLSLFHWRSSWLRNIRKKLAVYGRVPLFLYLTHLLLFAMLGRLVTPTGSSYLVMYLIWLLGLAILYPLAQMYSDLKARPRLHPVLQYL
jgi:uncharacterized membrane protein